MLYLLHNMHIFNSVVKNKKYKCPFCIKVFKEPSDLYYHVDVSHHDKMEDERSPKQIIYDETHPIEHLCQICKTRKCVWKEKTGRYSTLCDQPECREEARRRFRENYKRKHGKEHTINDPEIQRQLQRKRKCAGTYTFQDGGTLGYLSLNEKDFLEFCDITLGFPSDFIRSGDTFIFYYIYENQKHFYMLDYYIEDYNLLIEIKADDDISHPKILAVDKEKEILKDKAVIDSKKYNYIKIVDRRYEQFVNLIEVLKAQYVEQKKNKEEIYIVIPERKKDIRGFIMPKLEFLHSIKDFSESFIMKKILDQTNGHLPISLIIDKDNVEIKDDPLLKDNGYYNCRTTDVDFTSDAAIKLAFKEFSKYYTKRCEHFINQDFMSIRMDLSKTNFFALKVKHIAKTAQKKLVYQLLTYCESCDILNYSFFETSTGFVFIAGNIDNDEGHTKISTFCNELHKKSEYSKSIFDFDTIRVQAPGTVDANTRVTFIQV